VAASCNSATLVDFSHSEESDLGQVFNFQSATACEPRINALLCLLSSHLDSSLPFLIIRSKDSFRRDIAIINASGKPFPAQFRPYSFPHASRKTLPWIDVPVFRIIPTKQSIPLSSRA
jgi:hypothetical protein